MSTLLDDLAEKNEVYSDNVHMNTFEICKAVCNLSDSIKGAGIIDENKLVAMDSKPGVPIPTHERMEKLFFQTSLIAGTMLGNSDFFGTPEYFTLHFKNADLFMFHLLEYGIHGVLAVQVSKQHNHEQIVDSVNKFLQNLTQIDRQPSDSGFEIPG